MASERKFSRPGGVPTDYEVELLRSALLAAAAEERHWMSVARSLFKDLGPALGTRALLIVLDSVGGEKLRTPRREWLLQEIEREALVNRAEAMAAEGYQPGEIARTLDRSTRWVHKHLCRRARQRADEAKQDDIAA